MTTLQMERTAVEIAELSRTETIKRLRNFKGRFKLDFTPAFLKQQSTDWLRHALFGAVTHCGK